MNTMEQHQLEELKSHIADTVRLTVNGKIDNINNKLTDYIKDDMKWKKEYEPYIKGLANITDGTKIVIWVAVAISSLIGAFLGIKELFK